MNGSTSWQSGRIVQGPRARASYVMRDPPRMTALERGPVRIYKNRNAGTPRKAPRCICCFPQSRAGQVVPLRYGVQLVLCEQHRDPTWISAASGRFFLASVAETFKSLGLTGQRYVKALRSFVDDALGARHSSPRPRPGSYTWPSLRARLEEVWRGGGSYHDGERELVDALRVKGDDWPMPSPHTVRRWWREKRWLFTGPEPERSAVPRANTANTAAHARRRRLTALALPRSSTLAEWRARAARIASTSSSGGHGFRPLRA